MNFYKKYIDFYIKKLYNNIPPQKFEVFKILNTYYTRIKIIYSLLSTIEGSFSISNFIYNLLTH